MFISARLTTLLKTFLKVLLPAVLLLAVLEIYLYETHLQVVFYPNGFKYKEVDSLPHLTGCFDPQRVSSLYNLTERLYGPKRNEIQAGINVRFGLDCYDLAGTITSADHGTADRITLYHTYWAGTAPLDHRQEWMFKSFFATQNLRRSRLMLWSSVDLRQDPIVQRYSRAYPESFELRMLDSKETSVAFGWDSDVLQPNDVKDSSRVPFSVLFMHGGVWVDIDVLLTRDLEPLLEHEFVTEWGCGRSQPILMRFFQHSPYLCEAFHSMPRSARSVDWESIFSQLWLRLVTESIPPFKILPFCFVGSRTCQGASILPEPFAPKSRLVQGDDGQLDRILSEVFGVHLPKSGARKFPEDGWVRRLLLHRYERKLGD